MSNSHKSYMACLALGVSTLVFIVALTSRGAISPSPQVKVRRVLHSVPPSIHQRHLDEFPPEDFQAWVSSGRDTREAYRSVVTIAELLQDQLSDEQVLFRGY